MTGEPGPHGDDRVLATLEAVLATQREILAELRRAGTATEAQVAESLALQRQAAERGSVAVATAVRSAKLYRVVVTVAGALVLGGVLTIAWLAFAR
ncbi:MAG TPA: hypothetical protein VKS60_14865 [Stellaceae bacterium]|nr:hypothetical protein [Stellaceae bacterium]